jgi:hypothetical protein
MRQYDPRVPDEHVFTVAGASAVPVEPITLSEAGFTERSHLKEWVVAHPSMLGSGVIIVTLEFDRWWSSSGAPERDRLDVLGLDRTGRLVVAELKRAVAPDTVEMQALKYAAMASRFTPETLATQHSQYLTRRGEPTDERAAHDLLEAHSEYDLVPENLAKPRVVLLASSFPPVVTATAVWLTEMSLDITLMRFQAYRAEGQIVVTVSQLYPVPDVEDFTVAPARAGNTAVSGAVQLPEVPWTAEDLQRLRDMTSSTVLAALDLGTAQPGGWIPLREIEERAGREHAQARADLAVLTMTVKRHFGRSNWPFLGQWAAGGERQFYYSMSPEVAAMWKEVSSSAAHTPVLDAPSGADGIATPTGPLPPAT